MVGGGMLLGTLGVFVEEAGQHPFITVWCRCLFGALALLAWGILTGCLHELRLTAPQWGRVVLAGVLVVLNWVLFFAAIGRTSIAVATVVFHVQPLWVMAAGAWLLREQVSGRQWAAASFALAGLALATGLAEPGDGAASWSASYLVGLVLCLGGSLSYAAVTLIAKSSQGVSAYALALGQCAVGVLALAWWPLWQRGPAFGAAWLWLAGLGVLHTALAYVLLYTGMARLPAARIGMLQFVYPGAAVVMDWLVYGRVLGPSQSAGVLIMAGALLAARPARA